MATESTLEHYIEKLGHDGSELWWPDIPDPYGRRCFDVQECANVAFKLGYFVHEIRNSYAYGPPDREPRKIEVNPKFLENMMFEGQGILLVTPKYNDQNSHCVAWDRKEVFDPLGFMTCKEYYNIESFLMIGRRY
jgi:hypothetical protein